MKKVLLSVVLICLCTTSVFADSWESVAKFDDGEYLVNVTSIKVDNSVVQYWMKYLYQIDGIMKAKMRFQSVNCTDRKTYTTFESADYLGDKVQDISSMAKTKKIIPNTPQEKVINFVCDYKDYE